MKKIILLIIISFTYCQTNDLFLKASLALKSGHYIDALKHISDSKKQRVMNPEIYKIEGLIYEAINDRVNAIIAWNNCLKYSNDTKLT